MIPEKINNLLRVVKHGSNVNTYKVAWAKAIVEICSENPCVKAIDLSDIAVRVYKFYWNQTIYFNLVQGNNPSKPPAFVSIVRNDVKKYYEQYNTTQPVHFERVESKLSINIKELVRILKADVSWRFPMIQGQDQDVYSYRKGDDRLFINYASEISDYGSVLIDVINFKWTQVLENFNSAPKIAKKVMVVDFPEIKRKSLNPFKKALDLENPDHRCFDCGSPIEDGEVSIDHVIPWSYVYSDDLWNLVYVHKSCNSSKSNKIPTEEEIDSLEKRNASLVQLVKTGTKNYEVLSAAIKGDYVKKFWVGCK
jgi:5-methylcytosine-specific restriction endonuclease McrA